MNMEAFKAVEEAQSNLLEKEKADKGAGKRKQGTRVQRSNGKADELEKGPLP